MTLFHTHIHPHSYPFFHPGTKSERGRRKRLFSLFVFLWIGACIARAAYTGPNAAPHNDTDSLLQRIFGYEGNYGQTMDGTERNFYMKYDYRTMRRNFTLMMVPNMYPISRGNRNYTGETYGRIRFHSDGNHELNSQVAVGTIGHYKKIFPVLVGYITPKLYQPTLIGDFVLSPFHADNKRFYRYQLGSDSLGKKTLAFWPRINNTQLVKGKALVDPLTGKIEQTTIKGSFDLIIFSLELTMDEHSHSLIPQKSDLFSVFKLMGNRIGARTTAFFNCPVTLADSMKTTDGMALMDSLRPIPLTAFEKSVYRKKIMDEEKKSEKSRIARISNTAWDVLGDRLVGNLSAGNENAYIKLSPLLNPFYLSYSQNKGLSYKLKLTAEYNFSPQQGIELNPMLGYNFKQKQIYFTLPLRFTYWQQRKGWVELIWKNGNRITNSTVLDKIKDEMVDTINFDHLGLDYFRDYSLRLSTNLQLLPSLGLNLGFIYHRRTALSGRLMNLLGKPHIYRSFAPNIQASLQPYPQWPMLTVNYERGIKGVANGNTKYERIESDLSYHRRMSRLRQYSLRLGGGFYTDRSTTFFVDYDNFHDNYLPDGWEDDWTGHFQLLTAQWYNASRYYIKANAAYESPMMALSRLPLVGRYIETERLYAGILQIERIHTPYIEVGYGMTNRFFSAGLFASFVNANFEEIGAKCTVELFKKW